VDVMCVFKRFGKIWEGGDRPRWPTHAHVADLFSYRINLEMAAMEMSRASERACVGPHVERGCTDFLNAPPHGCTRPLSAFYANPSMFEMLNLPRVHPIMPVDGIWKLTEDVPGRPGFITTTRSGSWIEFPVRFGAVPVLIITFLQSYENIGDAEVRFGNMTGAYRVDARFKLRYSQVSTLNIPARNKVKLGQRLDAKEGKSGDRSGFGVAPNSSGTFQVRLGTGPKFKITSVLSC